MELSIDRTGAAEAQRAMTQVRKSVNAIPLQFLPQAQRMAIEAIISDAERGITQSLEATVGEPFRFNDLPGEIKNRIYAMLVVSDDIIKPVLSKAKKERSYRSHHSCGGQILSTSSIFYREAMTMLSGYNVFELTPSLCDFLGRDLRHEQPYQCKAHNLISYKDRLAMVQYASISAGDLHTRSHREIIQRLTGLKKLIIYETHCNLHNDSLQAPASSCNWYNISKIEFANNSSLQRSLDFIWLNDESSPFPYGLEVYYALTKYTSATTNAGQRIPVSYFNTNWKIVALRAQVTMIIQPGG